MKESSFWPITFTSFASHQSTSAKVLESLNLDEVVQLYVPAANDQQLEALDSYIHHLVLCRIPLRGRLGKAKRQFIYCRYNTNYTDETNLLSYEAVLGAVFGYHLDRSGRAVPNYHARIYKKGGLV